MREELDTIVKESKKDLFIRISTLEKKKEKAYDRFPNVLFFANEMKSNFGKGHTLTDLLKRKGNYRALEIDHSYIQWIFPNKYRSMFNS